MNENEVKEIFKKSIWDMTTAEIIENNLAELWQRLVDEAADED